MPRSYIPSRAHAHRRDRHGRGLRGPVIPFSVPAWRTRADEFDDVVVTDLAQYRRILGGEVAHIDYGVLDVPESDPAPWERGIPLARYLPSERGAQVTGRIVLYRMPILQTTKYTLDPRVFIHDIVTEQSANALGRPIEEIDYLR